MKKILERGDILKYLRKTMRIMRLSLFLIMISTAMAFSATSYSQNTKLTLDLNNATVKEVIKAIEDQSEFLFFYQEKHVNLNRQVTLHATEQDVETILNQLFAETNNIYVINDRQIVIGVAPRRELEKQILRLKGDIKTVIEQPQQKEITGKVTDTDGLPLPGVSIIVKGTTIGTVTNNDGVFSLNVPLDAETLQFSFVGMRTQEMAIEGRTTFTVVMKEETIGLEEVVAIGYGTMKKSDLTGSVASVRGEEISVRSPIRVSQSLQGITPGLMVTRSGASAADASASIRIRGITTIGDSNPLIIIDGVPGNLDWVNPNDIESISVLKDAASSSIYGSRAAAGVILVTTKKAKSGQLRMSYDYHYTIEEPTRTASYADAVDYMKVHNELSWNDNNNIQGGEYPIYSKDLIDNYRQLNAEDPYNYPNTDWHDLMVKKSALQKKHMLSLTGGTEHVSSYISLNMENTDGLFLGKSYDRITIRANNDIKINQYFSAEVNLNGLYSVNTTSQPSQSGQAIVPGPIGAPVFPAEWPDGRIAPGKGGENPYAILKHAGSVDTKANVMGGKAQINYSPIHSLRFSAAYFAELYDSKTKNFRKQLTYTSYEDPLTPLGLIRRAETTKLNESRYDRLSTNFQILSNFNESFASHDIALMAGFEENYTFSESLGAWRDQFALKNFPYLNIGNENYQYNSGSAYEYANRSFFGRVIYDYNDKYLLQSNIRYLLLWTS